MHIVFMGPPGSGKGTQAVRLAKHLQVPHLSTGDMLRAAKQQESPLGVEAASYMDHGNLAPDDLVVEVLISRIQQPDCAGGMLLDGFPRTIKQAMALDEHLAQIGKHVDLVVELEVPESVLIERIMSRQGNRADDNRATIHNRFEVYQRQTTPLRGYYVNQRRLAKIDGTGSMDEVFARVRGAVDAIPQK